MRVCDYCAGEIAASAPRNTKYCSPKCRKDSQRAPELAVVPPAAESEPDPLVEAVRRELEAAARLDTSLGQQALAAAERMGAASGSAFAALSKELRELMTAATKGAATAVDPIDELKLRRDRKSG
ncbi:hypothetical protein LTT66_18270 [Nocardia gipuzkoensis]|uniref:hypothetical protein n=1 Tax=Nocardia gipuzkoensis TaxID=2749991 RepID=UPI001E28B86E|nr:hypothetical protein [Nocardia gipuzkoensis]UGT65316.1 hypothetical protein LTT66_18270 [Nocardia gipuzkoensis]